MKRIFNYRALFVLAIALSLVFLFQAGSASAHADTPDHPVTLYLFWGEGCPHCAAAKPYLEGLPDKYPTLSLEEYEVYYDPHNNLVFNQVLTMLGLERAAVPTMVIGPYYLQGYSEDSQSDIEAVIQQCVTDGCVDVVHDLLISGEATASGVITSAITGQATDPTAAGSSTSGEDCSEIGGAQDNILEIPILGYIDLSQLSLGVSTALIAVLDGFNPCSLWALSMLLAITIHTGSRKKVFVIGLVFITVTALIYALFIAGLFSVLKLTGLITWMRVVVFLIAAVLGLINIKDYFWFKEGVSLTIDDRNRKGILQRMRALLDGSRSTGSLIGATILLAAGVSLVEFSCTAGLPILWTNLLNAQGVTTATFILLLLLYLVIYQADELIIFFAAVTSLKASRLEEKHGRILKLAGGILMLTLAVVMLINPAWMNELAPSLVVFAIALGIFLLVLLVHRVILPRLGIAIGSDKEVIQSVSRKTKSDD
jgi:thiol-disulfide isomerase/thioredoxin